MVIVYYLFIVRLCMASEEKNSSQSTLNGTYLLVHLFIGLFQPVDDTTGEPHISKDDFFDWPIDDFYWT